MSEYWHRLDWIFWWAVVCSPLISTDHQEDQVYPRRGHDSRQMTRLSSYFWDYMYQWTRCIVLLLNFRGCGLFQEYAETAMNELLGWYGYDKLDSRDTQGLNLHHFAAQRSPSDLDSSDAEGARSSSSPGRRDAGTGSSQGSPPLPGKPSDITR